MAKATGGDKMAYDYGVPDNLPAMIRFVTDKDNWRFSCCFLGPFKNERAAVRFLENRGFMLDESGPFYHWSHPILDPSVLVEIECITPPDGEDEKFDNLMQAYKVPKK